MGNSQNPSANSQLIIEHFQLCHIHLMFFAHLYGSITRLHHQNLAAGASFLLSGGWEAAFVTHSHWLHQAEGKSDDEKQKDDEVSMDHTKETG